MMAGLDHATVVKRVLPALEDGHFVIAVRGYPSTFAYQGLTPALQQSIHDLFKVAYALFPLPKVLILPLYLFLQGTVKGMHVINGTLFLKEGFRLITGFLCLPACPVFLKMS